MDKEQGGSREYSEKGRRRQETENGSWNYKVEKDVKNGLE